MEKGPGIPPSHGFWRWLVRAWFALTRRKIRLLQAGEMTAEGPALFAVSHPAGFLHGAGAVDQRLSAPSIVLLPERLARGPLAGFLARRMGIILYEGEGATSEATLQEAINVLANGGALVVFADQNAAGESVPGTLASTAASLVEQAEAQHAGRRVTVYPVHLFLPESTPRSREILIYVDSAIARPAGRPRGSAGCRNAGLAASDSKRGFRKTPSSFGLRTWNYFLYRS